MKSVSGFFSLLLLSALLVSCTPSSPDAAPTQTAIPSTPIPKKTASTQPQPTSTPTAVSFDPVQFGTQLPLLEDEISKENASQVVQLALWGTGINRKTIYSPDGNSIVVATSIGIRIYRADTLALIKFIETPSDIGSIAISPDGAILAAGGRDRLLLYQMSDGTLLKTIDKGIVDLVFSPDGRFLVIGVGDWSLCGNAALEIWNVKDWTLNKTLADDLDCIGGIAFSPSGKYLAASYFDVFIWEINGDQFTLKHKDGGCGIQEVSLAFTDDERFLVIGAYPQSARPTICLQRLSDWENMGVLKRGSPETYASVNIVPSPDHQLFATTEDLTINLWAPNPWKIIRTINKSEHNIFDVAWSPDGKKLISSVGNGFNIWDANTGKLLNSRKDADIQINKGPVTWLPNTDFLAAVAYNIDKGDQVLIQDTKNGTQSKLLNIDEPIHSLAVSLDGKKLAIGLTSDKAQIWNVQDKSLTCTLDGALSYGGTNVAFSADGSTIVLNIHAKPLKANIANVQVWDANRCTNLRTWEVKEDATIITDIDISSDQKWVAASTFRKIRIWNMSTGDLANTFMPPYKFGSIANLTFSPNGHILAFANDSQVMVLNIDDGKIIYAFEKPRTLSAKSFAWSPNGQLFAIGTQNGKIFLVDASNGNLIKTLEGPTGTIESLTFSSNGKILVSVAGDGTTRLWSIPH